MSGQEHITILGGGPAGLSVGYFASKKSVPFTIYEASDHVGGNCSTFQRGDFLLDSGAHRFHDKNPVVTEEVLKLMGDDILKISVPSQIYHRGKFIDFPLSPFDLIKKLGVGAFARSGFDLLGSRIKGRGQQDDFESFAVHSYGQDMADRFLLNYSRKLWGVDCSKLSSRVSGKRMKGLTLKTFVKEAVLGHKAKTEHLDGAFYYPKYGYGMIAQRLADTCGRENIKLNARVTKVVHDENRIQAVEINGNEKKEVEQLVNTLPLSLFLRMLEPAAPGELLDIIGQMKFRHVILVAFFLDKPSVTENGSLYFPDEEVPFTRVYEPRNRSSLMSPEGKTSLIAEVPCFSEDTCWREDDKKLIEQVKTKFKDIGWINDEEVMDACVYRLSNAYPVLELGFEEKLESILRYTDRFSNLKLSGRGGKFVYSWLHDMMQFGKDIVNELERKE